MAGCVEVPPMDVRVREFVASWFLERCLAKDEQETSIDFGKRLSSEFMMPPREKVDNGNLNAVASLDGERKGFSDPAAAHGTAIGKIQTRNMDKAKRQAVKASGGDKRRFSVIPKGAPVETGKAIDKIQTEKMDKTVVEVLDGDEFFTITSGASVETGVDNMQREEMDECAESDHVCLPPAMPRETPVDTEDLSFITDLAKLLNKPVEWIEKRKQQHKENTARSKRINDEFMKLCLESFNQGYDDDGDADAEEEEEEDDDDDDDDYDDADYARVEELNTRLWNEHCKSHPLIYGVNCSEEDNMTALA